LVEAKVVLRYPSRASEESRRTFVEAVHSVADVSAQHAEVGWTGDDVAFVAAACDAATPQDAAEQLEATIKTGATAGARWRLSTGLRIEVLHVSPLERF
jgi:hypothetical protein